jgi:hypothetical protein
VEESPLLEAMPSWVMRHSPASKDVGESKQLGAITMQRIVKTEDLVHAVVNCGVCAFMIML